MNPKDAFAPSLWSEVRAALLDLARSLRPPAPLQPVPVPVHPRTRRGTARRLSARR